MSNNEYEQQQFWLSKDNNIYKSTLNKDKTVSINKSSIQELNTLYPNLNIKNNEDKK